MGIIRLKPAPNYKLDHQVKKIRAFLDSGDLLHAFQLLQGAQAEFSGEFRITELLIECYIQQGKNRLAHEAYLQYLDANPDDEWVVLAYGRFLFHQKKWNKALKVFRSLEVSRYPNLALLSGYCSFRSGNLKAAKRYFEYYIRRNEEKGIHSVSYYYLSLVYAKTGMHHEAVPLIESLADLFSDNPRVARLLTYVYMKCDMTEHALRSSVKALALLPENKKMLALAITVMLHSKEGATALKAIEKYEALAAPAEKRKISFWKADAYLYEKKYAYARRKYLEILDSDPENSKAKHALEIIAKKY
ncbi:MAG: tetratricopeptide repeat protein [Ignavibacteriaceae bacterium]|nr:tetratricopeptide repeat protein [Ignavibacteriaceae bacterium]